MLNNYGVKSDQIRIGSRTKKGYEKRDLYDTWERYLPHLFPPQDSRIIPDTPLPPSETAKHPKQAKQWWAPPVSPAKSETSETRETGRGMMLVNGKPRSIADILRDEDDPPARKKTPLERPVDLSKIE